MNGTTVKKNRQSNLECLRILSMLLVMLVHYLPLRLPTDYAMVIANPLKALMNLELHSIGIICVHCFILISGYFGIKSRLSSFLSLLFQLLFWAIGGYLIAKYIVAPYYPIGQRYGLRDFLSSLWHMYQGRWFVSAYVTLYIFSPVINSFIDHTNERQLLRYILVFYTFSTIFGYVMGSKEFATGLSAISLMVLYLIGAWLRKSSLSIVRWSKWYDMTGYVVCTLIMTMVSFLLLRLGVKSSIYGYLNPLVIIESIFLFQFFRKWELRHIHWINYLAAGAFAAFLLHCNAYLGPYCNELWRNINVTFGCSVIYALLSIVLIFVLSVMIDKARVELWKCMSNLYISVKQMIAPPNGREKVILRTLIGRQYAILPLGRDIVFS